MRSGRDKIYSAYVSIDRFSLINFLFSFVSNYLIVDYLNKYERDPCARGPYVCCRARVPSPLMLSRFEEKLCLLRLVIMCRFCQNYLGKMFCSVRPQLRM